jgi:hypothetical protein
LLLLVVALAFGSLTWGIRKSLPYTPEIDEPIFVKAAVRIAATGNLNPGWFGHPGSTVIYPLAFAYRPWYAAFHQGTLFRPDPDLQTHFDSSPAEYYVLGRLLVIAYATLTLPLIYQLGCAIGGPTVGLIGAWLFSLSPLALEHAQIVRTDSPSTFFGLLSLLLCVKLLEKPRVVNHVAAGAAIGLAVATRYFMVALIPVFIILNLWRLLTMPAQGRRQWLVLGTGLLSVGVTFTMVTPYFLLDLTTAVKDVLHEARSTHLGSDGLPPLGNLLWYLGAVIPRDLGWPQLALTTLGGGFALGYRRPAAILTIGFVAVFLVGISLSPLHESRWTIQILPVLALLAGLGALAVSRFAYTNWRWRSVSLRGLALVALAIVSCIPGYQLLLADLIQVEPTTRVHAREWLVANLPSGSRVAQEWYCAPLGGTSLDATEYRALAPEHTVAQYAREGFRYLVASSAMYDRYLAEPTVYAAETAFYQDLFASGRLLRQFQPSLTSEGPTIRVYEIPAPLN